MLLQNKHAKKITLLDYVIIKHYNNKITQNNQNCFITHLLKV